MNELGQSFNEALRQYIGRVQIKQITQGTAVDIGTTTCTVKREGLPDLLDVRLDAVDDTLENAFTVFPKEGSYVVVGILENMTTEAVVLRCSEIENIKIKCNGISFIDTIDELIKELNQAIINTPAGAGTVSPSTVTKLNAVNDKFKKIFV